MPQFQTTERIRAPAQRVWTVLADFERWPQWALSITRIELLESRPFGVGSRYRVEQPKLRPAIWVVTQWEPERRFTWESASPGVRVVGGHTLTPSAEGCVLTLDLHFGGWLGGAAGFLMRGLTQHYMRLEAEGLKARSEGSR